jgi:hypothetical protein
MRLLALGCLPAVVRRRCEIRWTKVDRLRYAAVVAAIRESGRVVPTSAYRAFVPLGTPLGHAA